MSTPSDSLVSAEGGSAAGRQRRLAGATFAGAVAGAALWFGAGVLTADRAGPAAARVGLLPKPVYLVAATALVAAGVFALQRFTRLRRANGWYYPLFCSAIQFLPWLPVRLPPAAFLWSGPACWWLWASVGMAMLAVVVQSRVWSAPRWLRAALQPARAPWLAAGLAAALCGVSAHHLARLFPGGDEPHYLVITQSLLNDGDLEIGNNHERGDYRAYFSGTLNPDFLRRSVDGRIYSIHAPGLPALVAPAFAIGGYRGVVTFLIGLAALLSMLVWRTAFLATGSRDAAWFAWMAIMLSSPVFLQAFQVYPDLTGALAVATGVYVLVSLDCARAGTGDRVGTPRDWPPRRWLLVGCALAVLPWLHTRYAVLALVLGLVLTIRLAWPRGRLASLACLAAVPLISAACWFAYFKSIYGTFSPSAPYGHYTQTRLAYLGRGVPGLLFDQQFGLLPNAPVYVVVIAGLLALGRRRPRLVLELLLLILPYAGLASAYAMWWGGWSTPVRFLVPVLPVLAVPAAVWWHRQRAVGRAVGAGLLGVTLLVTLSVVLVNHGSLIFNVRDGASAIHEWLSPLVDLNRALPSAFRPSRTTPTAIAAVWLTVLAVAVAGLRWAWQRAGAAKGIAALSSITILLFAGVAGLSTDVGWHLERAEPYSPTASQMMLMEATRSPVAGFGFTYPPLRLMSPSQTVSMLRLSRLRRRIEPEDGAPFGLAAVPAGVYTLDPLTVSAPTTLSVMIGRGDSPIAAWDVAPSSASRECLLRLPCPVNAVVIDAPALRRSLSQLALRPMEVWRGEGCPAERALRGTRYGSGIVYFFDTNADAEPDGFWVRGTAEAVVAIQPDPPARLAHVRIGAGPIDLKVRVAAGAWKDEVSLAAGEGRLLSLPLDRRTGAVIARISADRSFVPALEEPGNQDTRALGCRVTIEP